ncbi:LOW QUALITY PROTEIN: hypothetical protein TorRG33x02_242060, partial [Trema orientale]
ATPAQISQELEPFPGAQCKAKQVDIAYERIAGVQAGLGSQALHGAGPGSQALHGASSCGRHDSCDKWYQSQSGRYYLPPFNNLLIYLPPLLILFSNKLFF